MRVTPATTRPSRPAGRRGLFLLAVILASLASVLPAELQATASVDTANRSQWKTTSTQMYQLWGSGSTTWQPIDTRKLQLSIPTPGSPSTTFNSVLTANADVFTTISGYNGDLGIFIQGGAYSQFTLLGWKEAGGYTNFKPAAVYVQAPAALSGGTTYTVQVRWRTNTAMAVGNFLQVGAGNGPTYSPTTLSAQLTPSSPALTAGVTNASPSGLNIGYASAQATTTSLSWVLWHDSNGSGVSTTFTTPSNLGNLNALVTASLDTFTGVDGTNQDIGLCFVQGSSTSACSAPVASEESAGSNAYKPIAGQVQYEPSALTANTAYTVALMWKAGASTPQTIYGGAGGSSGGVGYYSPSSIVVQMSPTSDLASGDPEIAGTSQTAQQTRSYSSGDTGTSWEAVPNVASLTFSAQASSGLMAFLSSNLTVFANSGSFNIDVGICVIQGSSGAGCNNVLAWVESGSAVAWGPDASYLQAPFQMQAGTTYTAVLEWKTNSAMSSGNTIYAGTGSSLTSLSNLLVPYDVPGAVTGLSAIPGNGSVALSWTAPVNSPGSPLTGYAVTPSTVAVGGMPATTLETMTVLSSSGNPPATSFTVPNLTNGLAYTFQVTALNNVGSSSASSTGPITPGLPGAPTGVSASVTSGQATVSWTAPAATGASALTGYTITPFIGSTAQTPTRVWGPGLTSAPVTGLSNGTAYTFKVTATNAFGDSPLSSASNSVTPSAVAPGAPSSVQATAGNAQASVSWVAPASDGGASITSYTITPYIAGVAQTAATATSSPSTVTGLTNGVQYTFAVAATNSVGTGSQSASSWPVYPALLPNNPAAAVTVTGAGPSGWYAIGTNATYQASLTATAAAPSATYTETLPAGLDGRGSQITVNGAACVAPVACTASQTTITVSGLTLGTTATLVGYTAAVTGGQRSCQTLTDLGMVSVSGGNSAAGSVSLTACDAGLGTPPWQTTTSQALGAGSTAAMNVADGNLMVTAADAIPMQLHGALTLNITRTYNSQDSGASGMPMPLGAGWFVGFAKAGSSLDGMALLAPGAASYASTTPMTLVDTSGTRYVYIPSALGTVVDVDALSSAGPLATLTPRTLARDSGYSRTCIDTIYTPPAGDHVAMFRYVENTGTSCSGLSASQSQVLGYVTMGMDRVRREFDATGHLRALVDAAGNEVDYTWTSGRLTAVGESGGSGRGFTIGYSSNTVTITDPGGEITTYTLNGGSLVSVANPDGTSEHYTYGGCAGSAASQLCSVQDPNGHSSHFTYVAANTGPPQLASWTDRDGNTSSVAYTNGADPVTVTRIGASVTETQRYASIDASGRVGELDEGSNSAWLHQTLYGWDNAGSLCRQPDPTVDNDLCSVIRRASPSSADAGAADRVSYFTYNDEGATVEQNDLDWPGNVVTTTANTAAYFQADGTVTAVADTITGPSSFSWAARPASSAHGGVLFAVSDLSQSLPPNGNAAGSGFASYLTARTPDNSSGISPNRTVSGSVCSAGGAATSNTGLLCAQATPSPTGTGSATTKHTYDGEGQLASTVSPNGGTTNYTVYPDTSTDLSGQTDQGGWLKGITDPLGNFAAFAYDREGHLARTWDRTATAGVSGGLGAFPGAVGSPPQANFSETLYESGQTGNDAASYDHPGRYALGSRTPMNDWTLETRDSNGNVWGSDEPLGTNSNSTTSVPSCPVSSNSTYVTCHSYDANDNLLTVTTPLEASPASPTTYRYDAFDNRIQSQDPVTAQAHGGTYASQTYAFDAVNRMTSMTQGMWNGNNEGTPNDAVCHASTGGNTWYQAEIFCTATTVFDGVDNPVAAQDMNANWTLTMYDALHRSTTLVAPRAAGGFDHVVSVTGHDASGNVIESCGPRQEAEDFAHAYTCTNGDQHSDEMYATYTVFNAANLPTSVTTNGSQTGSSSATLANARTYDQDGNVVSTTPPFGGTTSHGYDLNDRQTSTTVPRFTGTITTTKLYDPSGDVTSIQVPIAGSASQNTDDAYDYDHRVVDEVDGASAAAVAGTGPYSDANGTDVHRRWRYDADGNVIAEYSPDAFATSATSPNPFYMTATTYNADNEATASHRGRYDTSALTDPVSGSSATQENQCPTADASEQALGYSATTGLCTQTTTYDADGRRATVYWPVGSGSSLTTYAYNDNGTVGSEADPNPAGTGTVATTFQYDGAGRQTRTTDPMSRTTTTAYTADGLVSQVSRPVGASSLTHIWSYGYDSAGEQTSVTDGANDTTTTSFYPGGLTQAVSDALGDTTSYQYDGNGNVTEEWSPSANAKDATNPNATPTYYFYTNDNLLWGTLTPVNTPSVTQRAVCYWYDEAARKTDEAHQTTSSLSTTNTCGSSPPPSGEFHFNVKPDARVSQETSTNGSSNLQYSYDAGGQVLNVYDSTSGRNTGNSFYADGLTRSFGDGAGSTVYYGYDGAGQPTVRNESIGGQTVNATYGYTSAELLSSMSTSNGWAGSLTRAYDADGEVVQQVNGNNSNEISTYNSDGTLNSKAVWSASPNSSTLESTFTNAVDGAYRVTQDGCSGCVTATGGTIGNTWSYGYDQANRLTYIASGPHGSFQTYDHDGNRLSHQDAATGMVTTYTYNADDSMAGYTKNGSSFSTSYTTDGIMTSDGCLSYGVDALNRVNSTAPVSGYSSNCPQPAPTGTVTYSLVASGQQVSRTLGATTTTIHDDGLSQTPIAEVTGSTTLAYSLAPSGTAVSELQTGSSAEYLTLDTRGSVGTTTNVSSGNNVQCQLWFDPYGNAMFSASQANPCQTGTTNSDLLWQDGRRDATTGDYQMGTRSYDPSKNSFLQPDHFQTGQPAQDLALQTDPLTRNTYGYVNGDPVNLFDPSGHAAGCRFGTDCTDMSAAANASQAVVAHGGQTLTAAQGRAFTQRHNQRAATTQAHGQVGVPPSILPSLADVPAGASVPGLDFFPGLCAPVVGPPCTAGSLSYPDTSGPGICSATCHVGNFFGSLLGAAWNTAKTAAVSGYCGTGGIAISWDTCSSLPGQAISGLESSFQAQNQMTHGNAGAIDAIMPGALFWDWTDANNGNWDQFAGTTTFQVGTAALPALGELGGSAAALGGRTVLGTDAETLHVAAHAPPMPGVWDVVAHGDGYGIYADGQSLSASDVLNSMRADGYSGGPIRAIVCRASCGPAYGLSNEAGAPVYATAGVPSVQWESPYLFGPPAENWEWIHPGDSQ